MVNCSLLNIAAAVYQITDMIVFHVYTSVEDNSKKYLQVIVQEDEINEKHYVLEWKDIPEEIIEIYKYVNATGSLEYEDDEYILRGNHIGRVKNHNYTLFRMEKNPINKIEDIETTGEIDEEDMKVFSEMCENMKIVKKLM